MAEIITPFGVGFMVDETPALKDPSFHRDVSSATERARSLAEAYPGRTIEIFAAIEVRRANDVSSDASDASQQQLVRGLRLVTRREYWLSVVDIDGEFPSRELSRLHRSLDEALADLDRCAHRHPGRRFGLYAIMQAHRVEPDAASRQEVA